ncbi:MAG TPA: Ig-like domain-containing protein [Spirochaetota bacterium]|nr:Ig-like domain-containing protein [Spirochaetota bacterium]
MRIKSISKWPAILSFLVVIISLSSCRDGIIFFKDSFLSLINPYDLLRPHITSTIPANNASNVPINSALVVIFNRAMDPATINQTTFYVSDSTGPIPGTVIYTGTSATFTPSAFFSPNTTYTATVTAAAADLDGKTLPANHTWRFSTGAAPDTTSPTVASTFPADGAANVAINSGISVTFDEAMDPATISTMTFMVQDFLLMIPVTGTVSYTGNTALFSPIANLSPNTTYLATITTGATDLAGNPMAADHTWTFTTGTAPDLTPPAVTSTTPAGGATNVAVSSVVTVVFTEDIDPATISAGSFTINDGASTIGGTVSCAASTAVFSPSAAFSPSTTYTANLSTAIADLAGNTLMATYTWSFTTGDAPTNNAQGLKFHDIDPDEDSVGGTGTIKRAVNESDIVSYVLYWGSSASTKLAATPQIIEIPKTGFDITFPLVVGTAVPAGATHMLVYSKNTFGESAMPVALDFDDMVCRMIEINPGIGSSMPESFAVFNNRLYFNADDGSSFGEELWVYDDSQPIASGTNPKMAWNINPGSNSFPRDLTVYNNKLYFGVNDGVNGSGLVRELWVYDDAGPTCTLAPGTGADSSPKYLKEYNGYLYFQGWNGTDGNELNEYDGTTSGVYDINPGSSDSKPSYLTLYGGNLYFNANNGTNGEELYMFDGTVNQVPDINPGINNSSPTFLTPFMGNLYFQAYDNSGAGIELWQYNGSTTSLVNGYDINPSGHSNPSDLYVYNNRLYFRAENGTDGQELWVYDGTANPFMVDIYPGPNSSYPKSFTEFNGKLYFSADNNINGQELWVYDGTMPIVIGDNMRLACEINTAGSAYVDYLFNYHNRLYFQATDGTNGYELWCFYIK